MIRGTSDVFDARVEDYTPYFDWLLRALAVGELDFASIMPFDCTIALDHHERVLLRTITPLVIGSTMAALAAVAFYLRRRGTWWKHETREKLEEVKETLLQWLFFGMFIICTRRAP